MKSSKTYDERYFAYLAGIDTLASDMGEDSP